MKFLVITHVLHKKSGDRLFAYAPYVREMNLWAKHVGTMVVIGPMEAGEPQAIDLDYAPENLQFIPVPGLNFSSFSLAIRSMMQLPGIVLTIAKAMRQADHLHLRCPGNMGLIGCFLQILFPGKQKTAKYAGNWDFRTKQPWSYRLQQRLLRNTFLTRHMTALVYGKWPDQSRNILPFFTASYRESDITDTPPRALGKTQPIRLIFVGTLTENKRPALAVATTALLKTKGYQVHLDLYGDGIQKAALQQIIAANNLQREVELHGNVGASHLEKAYQRAHFLLFASRSEGWPKAVAEAMFWGCLPITTPVSCVPDMLGQGLRGHLVAPDAQEMASVVEAYVVEPEHYHSKCLAAMKWSRQYTLDFFETEIARILQSTLCGCENRDRVII